MSTVEIFLNNVTTSGKIWIANRTAHTLEEQNIRYAFMAKEGWHGKILEASIKEGLCSGNEKILLDIFVLETCPKICDSDMENDAPLQFASNFSALFDIENIILAKGNTGFILRHKHKNNISQETIHKDFLYTTPEEFVGYFAPHQKCESLKILSDQPFLSLNTEKVQQNDKLWLMSVVSFTATKQGKMKILLGA